MAADPIFQSTLALMDTVFTAPPPKPEPRTSHYQKTPHLTLGFYTFTDEYGFDHVADYAANRDYPDSCHDVTITDITLVTKGREVAMEVSDYEPGQIRDWEGEIGAWLDGEQP